MNYENANVEAAVVRKRNPIRAVSNRDYRNHPLPSIFGPLIAEFLELEHGEKWLRSLPYGGRLDRWNDHLKDYESVLTVEAAK